MELRDGFGRPINYLRLSVTDRCDFRCVYCMAEDMQFLPRKNVLNVKEMTFIAQAFSELGVKKIRLTGGEPLIHRDIEQLLKNLNYLQTQNSNSLEEITLTTNGSQLQKYAHVLANNGINRINVSLDSLDSNKFKNLTRTGNIETVFNGINAAIDAGLKIKLNSVILKNRNHNEVINLVEFAVQKKLDISFIEEMPLGMIEEHKRDKEFISSDSLRAQIEKNYGIEPTENPTINKDTAGPSRYWKLKKHSTLIGFISPHSDNFCASCNRVRVTAEGQLLLCLGNENNLDLRQIIRQDPNKIEVLKNKIIDSMNNKPEKHHFDLSGEPQIVRFMNMTGG